MIHLAGHLRLRADVREDGRTALAEQSFRAPFHLSKPHWDEDARILVVQVVNPTAGILAGDRLTSEIKVGPGASVLVTTPSASRVFMMQEGVAESRQRFVVAADAWLDVSPEPLVPHRGSRFWQATEIEMEAGGGLFYIDQIMPGRLGFGEAWAWTELRMDLTVRIADELVLRERLAHSGPELAQLARFAGTGPRTCLANAIFLPPGVEQAAPWREALNELHRDGVWIGVSALRRGGWTFKIAATDPLRLRETIRVTRMILADHYPPLACTVRKL